MHEKDTKNVCDKNCTTCRYEDTEYDESPCVDCVRGDGDDEMWKAKAENPLDGFLTAVMDDDRSWEMFKAGDFAMILKDRADYDDFMEQCEKRGIVWNSGTSAKEFIADPMCLNIPEPVAVGRFGEPYGRIVYSQSVDAWRADNKRKYYLYGGEQGETAKKPEQPQIKDSGDGYPTKYRDNILKLMEKQRAKGIAKYGSVLEDNRTLSIAQRIDHLEEELIDALMYCEHIREILTDHLLANDYQRMAMRTASGMIYTDFGDKGLLLNSVMGLNGEAGEVIDSVKKHCFQGHELDKAHLAEELGDVAWYLAVGCEAIGVTLEDVMNGNVEKLKSRYPEGFDKNRSIHREEENA